VGWALGVALQQAQQEQQQDWQGAKQKEQAVQQRQQQQQQRQQQVLLTCQAQQLQQEGTRLRHLTSWGCLALACQQRRWVC
jgi:hypothetical protein